MQASTLSIKILGLGFQHAIFSEHVATVGFAATLVSAVLIPCRVAFFVVGCPNRIACELPCRQALWTDGETDLTLFGIGILAWLERVVG